MPLFLVVDYCPFSSGLMLCEKTVNVREVNNYEEWERRQHQFIDFFGGLCCSKRIRGIVPDCNH
jgi:hypothetical protein